VALSPEDIVNHEFKQALRGYAVQEVDDLLDRLADQLERAELDIADLRKRVIEAEARTTEALATESSLKRTLITAQDAAQRTMDDAETQAETVRSDADRQVTERLDEADARSTAMVQEAESEASTTRASYRSEQEASVTRVAMLAAIEERYRAQVRALLEHQLGEIERLEATGTPGGPEVEELRAALRRGDFDATAPETGDEGGNRDLDAGSDAFDGSQVVSDVSAGTQGSGGGQDRELVPFGGLTVRVADDGAGSSEQTDRHDDGDDGDDGDLGDPDRDAPA